MEHSSTAIIEGFITEDAKLQRSPKTKNPFILFSLAINHHSRPGEPGRVSFVEVEAWNALALSLKDRIKKGTKVMVEGRLRQDRWTEKDKICSRIKLFADTVYITTNT